MKRIVTCAAGVLAVAGLSLGSGAAQASGPTLTAVPATAGSFAGYASTDIVPHMHVLTANWIEPKVHPRGFHNHYATFAVGYVDSFWDFGVETSMPMIGTEADSIGGIPRYYAWYTPRPGNADCAGNGNCHLTAFRNSVRPGDHMSASATDIRGRHFTLKLIDVRYRKNQRPLRWTQTVRVSNAYQPPTGVSAGVTSWLADNDAGPPGTYQRTLADFGTATFTDVKLNGYVIGSFDITRYNYTGPAADGGTHLLGTASSLSSSGNRFTLTYKRMS